MQIFNRLIIALLMTQILISAQTPKSASEGAIAKPARGGVIAGRVTDSQGRPAVEERIRINRLDRRGEAQPYFIGNDPDMFMTDDRGIYRIHGVPPGRYIVSAGYLAREGQFGYPTPRFFYPQTFYPNVTDKAQAKVFEMTEGAEFTGVDIVLVDRKRSYDVYGRVVDADTGEPVPGITLSYGVASTQGKFIESRGYDNKPSDSTGKFRLSNVAPGRYVIFVYTTAQNDYLCDPTECEVGDDDLQNVDVRVRRGGSISGVALVEGTNDPAVTERLKNVRLYIRISTPDQWNLPRGPEGSDIASDGSFHLRAIQPGKVWLDVSQRGDARGLMLSRMEWNGSPHRGGFDVVPGEKITGVRLVFTYGSLTLRGQVKIEGVSISAGVRLYITATRPDQPPQDLQLMTEVNARGEFTLEHLSPGEYDLIVAPLGDIDPNIARLFYSIKKRVHVTENDPPITVTIDLRNNRNEK